MSLYVGVQVFAGLKSLNACYDTVESGYEISICRKDLRRDRKCPLKFREMLETQDAEESGEAQSKRSVPLC